MLEMVEVEAWSCLLWLRHGFSTRAGGVSALYGGNALNLGFTRDDSREAVERNRARAVSHVLAGAALATVRQVHGTAVARVGEGGVADGEADGLVTDKAGVLLGIQVADCVPLLLVDTRLRAVAALHAGWRGTVAGMAAAGVAAMQREFGSRVEDLQAAIGPSIGPCCFAVGPEVASHFQQSERRGGQLYVDLWEANRQTLLAAGVRTQVAAQCTACTRAVNGERRYFSHRAEAGVTGRAMGLIGVVDGD